MSIEEASPTSIPTQKSITDQKTTNNIRKITIQTLSPIVAKLEEHISFLLEQTSKLRSQNAKLAIATANQQALERQFDELSQNMEKLSSKLNLFNKDKDNKLKERQLQTKKLTQQLENLQKQSHMHSKRIDTITQNYQNYLTRIDQNKQEQLQSIDQLKISIENYYQQEIIKIESIREQFEETKQIITLFQDKRNADQEQIKQIMKITTLYEAERDDIKKIIEKTAFLENNVVMLPDYQKDKKFQRLSNEQTRGDIKTMLDQALTPQIRKFLPKLIDKLDKLQRFQETLNQIQKITQKTFQVTKKQQDQKINGMSETWLNKFTDHQQANNKAFDELNKKVNKNLQVLQQKIQLNQDKFDFRLRPVEQQLKKVQKEWREGLSSSISKLDSELRQFLNVWGQKFLDRKKDNIYQLVQTQKPPERHKEQNRVQQLVFSMEPLLNSVKQELKSAQYQVQSSKQTLYERLSFFNNQIVKMKSDMTRETSENKRILDTFSLKLHQNRDTCDDISLLLSKIVETTALSYALSLDQSYLHRQHEVYVTYNDGIMMEVCDNGQISYRRQQYLPQLLKRAVLTELIKIIDNSVLNKPLLNWNKSQFKPSHLNPSIQDNYKTLFQQNKNNIVLPSPKNTPIKPLMLQRKSLDSKLPLKKQYQNHHLDKLTPSNQIFSKTIDPDGRDFHNFHSATRYDIGYQEDKEYTGRRKNIKLKKIDKKDI